MATAIEWTRAPDGTRGDTWNPIVAQGGGWTCEKVSPECAYCYAERLNMRGGLGGNGRAFLPGVRAEPALAYGRIEAPMRWKRPRRVFVCSMTDLFWDAIPDLWIGHVFGLMVDVPQHNYLVLTKRAERMAAFVKAWLAVEGLDALPPHIWCGVTAGNQTQADRRIPELLKVPAAVRFLSCEPLLGPIDLSPYLDNISNLPDLPGDWCPPPRTPTGWYRINDFSNPLQWVIAGGESGGPLRRRLVEPCPHDRTVGGRIVRSACQRCAGSAFRPTPDALRWARELRDQCAAADVAFFFKQWGGKTPKEGGRSLDGQEYSQFPDDAGAPYAVLEPFTSPASTRTPVGAGA